MVTVVGKYQAIVLFLILQLFLSGTVARGAGEEVLPIRLVAMVDQDDQGERFAFPVALFYDSWSSETYLVSSTGRITIYDQKYFPVASFGKGRGVINPIGVAVDRRGRIYVCEQSDANGNKARLVIYNQAFFPIKEIVFANIPELAEFSASKVAVSESGEIYLTGYVGPTPITGVAVLTPDGNFSRILLPPENNSWRQKKVVTLAGKEETPEASVGEDAEATPIPASLKPKKTSSRREDVADQREPGPDTITDVKIDRQGRIYLLSRETSYTYVLNAKEEYLFKFGEKGGAEGKLSNPVSLGIDIERRTIYVCDYMRHSILCYDYDTGKFVFEFGGRGLGPLWFNFPNSLEVDQRGRVIVADLFNRRLQVIDTNMEERRPLVGVIPGKIASLPKSTTEESLNDSMSAPPALASVGQMGDILAPGAVLPPVLPAGLGGVNGLGQKQLSLPSGISSALRLHLTPIREFAPLARVPFSVPSAPRQFARPGKVALAGLQRSRSSRRLGGEEGGGVFQRFKWLPAAVAVYGPIAYTVSLGSRLLSTNR